MFHCVITINYRTINNGYHAKLVRSTSITTVHIKILFLGCYICILADDYQCSYEVATSPFDVYATTGRANFCKTFIPFHKTTQASNHTTLYDNIKQQVSKIREIYAVLGFYAA